MLLNKGVNGSFSLIVNEKNANIPQRFSMAFHLTQSNPGDHTYDPVQVRGELEPKGQEILFNRCITKRGW